MRIYFRRFLLVGLLFISASVFANSNELNLYNWAGYIPEEVLALFTQETGIVVNYSNFNSNQTLYTKLKANPKIGYDIVVPTNYIVARMIREGMLKPLDKSRIPNVKYLDASLLNRPYDRNNRFSVPYLWGTTGIMVSTKNPQTSAVNSWADLWNPQFKNQLAIIDSARDMFAVAFIRLGYPVNDDNPKHIKEAYLLLKKLLPNVRLFFSDSSQQMFINEDVKIGMIENGDAMIVLQENPQFRYVYPKEGALIWVDNLVIPVGATHLDNAYRFINFLLRPDVAKMIATSINFSSPNRAARKLMPLARQTNSVLYPSTKILRQGRVESGVSEKANRLYLKYWELLKLEG